MGKKEKLIQRLLSMPKDFTYDEMTRLLGYLGYQECGMGKTSGSAVRFIKVSTGSVIHFHKPHPNHILKKYVLQQVIEKLTREEWL